MVGSLVSSVSSVTFISPKTCNLHPSELCLPILIGSSIQGWPIAPLSICTLVPGFLGRQEGFPSPHVPNCLPWAEKDWTEEDRGREKVLMHELVTLIEQRNAIVNCMDEDRQR